MIIDAKYFMESRRVPTDDSSKIKYRSVVSRVEVRVEWGMTANGYEMFWN